MSGNTWLRDYFKKLSDNISNNEISSESSLSATVEFPLAGWSKGKSLLLALGYEKTNVLQQFAVKGIGTAKPRVDFVIGEKSNYWMLELKKPNDFCDRAKHVEQLQSYMIQENVALGVIFNGRQAFAYVNPEHNSVANICKNISEEEINLIPDLDLKKKPIKKSSINSGDTKEIIKFFRLFKNEEKLPDVQMLAFNLADQYIKKLRQEAKFAIRQDSIKNAFYEILNNPNDQLLEAIIQASNSLSTLKTKNNELLNIWPVRPFIKKNN